METKSDFRLPLRGPKATRVYGTTNVIPFRGRHAPATGRRLPEGAQTSGPDDLTKDGLAKYERGDGDDDYRHRMITNTAASIFTIFLATAGAWLAITIGDMRKNQDCYLSGRRNCTPIDVPSLQPSR